MLMLLIFTFQRKRLDQKDRENQRMLKIERRVWQGGGGASAIVIAFIRLSLCANLN